MDRLLHRALLVVLPLSLLAASGCASGAKSSKSTKAHEEAAPVPDRPLYERLGGGATISSIVDSFVDKAAADPKVNFTRKGTPMEWSATDDNVMHLKVMLIEFISSISGGPEGYDGRSMKIVHQGMMISNDEFNALAADLKATLVEYGVSPEAQSALLTAVEGTRQEIVEKK